MTDKETYRISKSISLSFINKHRVPSINVTDKMIEQNIIWITPLINTTSDNLKLHCLFVCYEYNPGNYQKMVEHVKYYLNKVKKPKFRVFCDNLKNNSKYYKEDIYNINLRYTQLSISQIFNLYRENKIRFYTLYELVKSYELSELQKIEIEKISVLMEFLIFEFKYKRTFIIDGNKINTNKQNALSNFF